MKNIEDLTKSKNIIIKHLGYFLGALGFLLVSIGTFVFALICSLLQLLIYGKSSFIFVWQEWFTMIKNIWIK